MSCSSILKSMPIFEKAGMSIERSSLKAVFCDSQVFKEPGSTRVEVPGNLRPHPSTSMERTVSWSPWSQIEGQVGFRDKV